MRKYSFNASGNRRKKLAGAISKLLNLPVKYLGVPTFAYEIGGYHIDKAGAVTGEYDQNLFEELRACGFEPEEVDIEELGAVTPEAAISEESGAVTPEAAISEESGAVTPEAAISEELGAPAQEEPVAGLKPDNTDILTVEYPLDGFTPKSIDNLTKMVRAKEPLLKKALNAEELPIRMTSETLQFPWFTLEKQEDAAFFTQFICALCQTAKTKKRVTAKAPAGDFENEKFAMRVWLTGLGLIGKEYGQIRKFLGKNLSGNSAWRYENPKKKQEKTTEIYDLTAEIYDLTASNADEIHTENAVHKP